MRMNRCNSLDLPRKLTEKWSYRAIGKKITPLFIFLEQIQRVLFFVDKSVSECVNDMFRAVTKIIRTSPNSADRHCKVTLADKKIVDSRNNFSIEESVVEITQIWLSEFLTGDDE